jgi:hypothetical protein
MKLLAKLRSYARSLTRRRTVESDIEAELHSHIDLRAADLERSGLTAAEAHRQARIEFGTIETHKANIRRSLGLRLFDELRADLRFATRMLRRTPGFTAIAIISLALGIGANTIIFTMTKGVLLDRLAVTNPSELRLASVVSTRNSPIHSTWGSNTSVPGGGSATTSFSYPVYEIMRDQNRANPHPVLNDLIAFKDFNGNRALTATIHGHAYVTPAQLVSGNFFEQLGVVPVLGRPIQPADDATPGAGAVAVISDGLWSRVFGRSPDAVGQHIALNLIPFTII